MKIKIFALFIVFTNFTVLAKPKIVTSITPLASIVAMLVRDNAEVSSIVTNNICPHHYHLKLSDLDKVRKANIVIYIDDQFDNFVPKLMDTNNSHIIKISNFKSLKIVNNNGHPNWHFWLDLSNVQILLEELSLKLAGHFPERREVIYQNLGKAKKRIGDLAIIKTKILSDLPKVILLSDSLEYFFIDNNLEVNKLYQPNHKSLKYVANLQQLLKEPNNKCLILSSDQDGKFYQKFNSPIIQLESENWQTSKEEMVDLFYNQYLKMINQVAMCK
jgi:zinc transport system substrate-binding protein